MSDDDPFMSWYDSLPEDRKFSPTQLSSKDEPEFEEWKKKTGLAEKSNDYDLRGWFAKVKEEAEATGKSIYDATEMVTDPEGKTAPHTGSIGRDGKILKSPNYPTFYMTAATEIMRDAGMPDEAIPYDEISKSTKAQAKKIMLQRLEKHGKSSLDATPQSAMTLLRSSYQGLPQ